MTGAVPALSRTRGFISRRVGSPKPVLMAGILMVAFWVVIAFAAPWIAPYDPNVHDYGAVLSPPSATHWLGTDMFGRDILSRIIHATIVDLQIGVLGVVLPFVLGTFIGLIAGYFGGVIDMVLMRLLDIMLAFPWLILLMAIIAVLGPGLYSFYIAITLVGWVSYARLVRSQVLVLKSSDFVMAARALGYGDMRIMLRHILPNALVASIVFSMSDVVLVLLAGASVSYLGMGVQPPTAEWGVMIAEGQTFITTAWWIPAFPGVAIVLMALGFSLLADGLAEQLDVDP
ncbi:binding-protein-dependent transport system inner membrane protein [Nitratireductor pacificus pht-3B]|uniref:Binding-protein-dependent transport system inner membrane protein n=2 Tax=Nitratireductor TaxID=245876 RepID=K2MZU3_9HYPH|nr:binding-protein-dependent transport system inner membrane protein [Nitratireductor pacificus pht-3B]